MAFEFRRVSRPAIWLAMTVSAVALAACENLPSFGAAADDGAAAPIVTPADAANARDIEAPEVFNLTEAGLWDGRPSLGGVWVAHPSVTDPERVIIRNTSNGRFVIGALFRRERENPGPALQVSSDAAEELGMLAGSPAQLNVIALRREEAPAPTETAITDFDAPEVIAAEPLDDAPAAVAAATPDAVAPAPVVQPAATSTLDKPFIQIGIFSIEENANNTATALRGDGLSANVIAQESQTKTFYRVTVGPAPTAADRSAVLDKVKALGFNDAYAVTN
ncbi:Sporulation related domain-containing protein [Loktanella sp. DSM 29012]|uniref:SPOR domain-containing protein n=1 Tax=Loktanella sp. DSM 29012 TaxID=1881056 RepID=UPI0008D811C0|nr:SPOR domain-containing protein [Loktanella sp. DSM 29012]SEQ56061.1 Sporulation related domain-containing protein [Loktanella sp. DSM 29012]